MEFSKLRAFINTCLADGRVKTDEAREIVAKATMRGPKKAESLKELKRLARMNSSKFETKLEITAMSPEGDVILEKVKAKKIIQDAVKRAEKR